MCSSDLSDLTLSYVYIWLPTKKLIKRINHLIKLPNKGRESDTYLYHVQHYPHGLPDEWTVFCQGDPFPHSPNFLKLLAQRNHWKDIQPLTSAYLHDGQSPPTVLLDIETDEWVRGIPVRTEVLSASTLRMIGWNDPHGASYIDSYWEHFGVPKGWSLSGHFLEQCGLTKLAEQAWQATLARSVYAAIFGIRNKQMKNLPKKCLPRMRKLASEHTSVGFVYERLWLHLFGLPFINTEVENKSATKSHTQVLQSL